MKNILYLLALTLLFSACSTSFKTSSNSNPKMHLALVKAKTNQIQTVTKVPEINQETITALPTKQVGVSVTSNDRMLKQLLGYVTITKTQRHQSLISKMVERKLIKKINKATLSANDSSQPNQTKNVLIICGILLLVFGIIILWYVSIAGGALLVLLGLILLIVGLASHSTTTTNQTTTPQQEQVQKQYQDVVYLKNGSVIRGMIIEQIPNVSLKIQTADGSIFVYQMSEVDKMTKELAK